MRPERTTANKSEKRERLLSCFPSRLFFLRFLQVLFVLFFLQAAFALFSNKFLLSYFCDKLFYSYFQTSCFSPTFQRAFLSYFPTSGFCPTFPKDLLCPNERSAPVAVCCCLLSLLHTPTYSRDPCQTQRPRSIIKLQGPSWSSVILHDPS